LDAVHRPFSQAWSLAQQTPLQHASPEPQEVLPQQVFPAGAQHGEELVWQQI